MRTMRLQFLLTCIALLSVGHASEPPAAECTARAWVRAPDLVPDSVIQGDVRVKISAGCPTVETTMLGLRLKERSVIKAIRSREDRNKLNFTQLQGGPVDIQRMTPWDFPRSAAIPNATIQEMLAARDLWVVREEEQLVFESTQVIKMAGAPRASGYYDVVQDFAVLIPSTNFPPALDYSSIALVTRNDYEVVQVELMYEYFIRVPFANGTTEDISAGVTGFQPLYNHAITSRWPNSQTARLRPMRTMYGTGKDSDSPVVNYTAQVSGLVFTQGSEDQVATVAITRTGPARTFTAPLKIQGCVLANFSSKWAIEYGMHSSRSMYDDHGSILRATPEGIERANRRALRPFCHGAPDAKVSLTMSSSTLDEIQSGDIVTTTSAAVTIPIKVDRRQVTDFETYYQTLANSLQITLTTPRTKDERVDPDEPSAEVPTRGPKFTNDEEPWVPWENKQGSQMPRPNSWATYIGGVPAVVRPMDDVISSQRCHSALANEGQVVFVDETDCEGRSLVHYLDEGARGPIFVDSSAIHELLAEDAATRNLRAPILAPVVSSPPEGEELVYRYYCRPGKPLIYVGETWVKKVVNRGGQKAVFAM